MLPDPITRRWVIPHSWLQLPRKLTGSLFHQTSCCHAHPHQSVSFAAKQYYPPGSPSGAEGPLPITTHGRHVVVTPCRRHFCTPQPCCPVVLLIMQPTKTYLAQFIYAVSNSM